MRVSIICIMLLGMTVAANGGAWVKQAPAVTNGTVVKSMPAPNANHESSRVGHAHLLGTQPTR